jgi:hypothetical protein
MQYCFGFLALTRIYVYYHAYHENQKVFEDFDNKIKRFTNKSSSLKNPMKKKKKIKTEKKERDKRE